MPTVLNQLLTNLKHIIETYQLVDSVDVLEYAAKLIHLLQGKNRGPYFIEFLSNDILSLYRSSFK